MQRRPDYHRFDAYDRLRSKVAEAFCPRILVVPSEKAKLICNSNYLTPAEFFAPFAKNLDFSKETKYTSELYNQHEYNGERPPAFIPFYKNIKLLDVEEWQKWQPIQDKPTEAFESSFHESFKESLSRNSPNLAEISKLSLADITETPRRSLAVFGWDAACNLTVDYLRTLFLDYEWKNLHECHALMYVISSEENSYKDTIIDLERKFNDQISSAMGVSPIDKNIIRIIVVLIREGSDMSKNDVDNKFTDLKNTYPQSLTTSIKLTSDEKDKSADYGLWWNDQGFYVKRKIKHYDLGLDKVDSNLLELRRGQKLDKGTIEQLINSMRGIFVGKLSEKIRTQLLQQWKATIDQKKTVKRGFMSFFKKEEKALTDSQGYYRLTAVEKEVKKYGDMLLVFGMINEAKEEYAFLIDILGKKSTETTTAINEMLIYCTICISNPMNQGYPLEKMKNVNKMMLEHLARSINYPYRYSRLQMVMNILNHCYYDRGEEPPREAQRSILQGHFKFSLKHNQLMFDFLSPFLLQQYSRYMLLNQNKCIRTFFAFTVECCANYLKRTDLKLYSLAGYIICSKYYGTDDRTTWGIVNELVFYNLAVLTKDNNPDDELEINSFITALNNMNDSSFGPSEIVKKADKGLKLKLSQFKKSLADQTTDLLNQSDPLTMSLNNPALTETVRAFSSEWNQKANINVEAIAKDKLKMIKVKGHAVITPNEAPHPLQEIEDPDAIPEEPLMTSSLGMSGSYSMTQSNLQNSAFPAFAPGTALTSSDKSSTLNRHFETFESVLKAKFPQACIDSLKQSLEFSKISSVGDKMKALFRPREVAKGEMVRLEFKIKNHYWSRIEQDFETLQLNFQYIPDPITSFNFTQEHNLLCPSPNHFTYKIHGVGISKGEVKTLAVDVCFLASGAFKLKGFSMKMFGLVDFTHVIPFDPLNKYEIIKVNSVDSAIIKASIRGVKKNMYFGEVQKSTIDLHNLTSVAAEEVYLISSEPLYTGFGFKHLGSLGGDQHLNIDYFIRGINPKLSSLSLFVVYKSNGQWKYTSYFLDVMVHKSFSTKYHSEDLEDGRRLICIDVINAREQSHVDPEQLEICSLRLNSNTWKIVKDSQTIRRDSKMIMIYFKVEPRTDIVPETQYLSRKHREVSCFNQDFQM